MNSFFITGTDTGIGKTFISSLLMIKYRGTYWKSIQSGLLKESDTEYVKRITGLASSHFIEEAYKLTEPRSPHESAMLDSISIDIGLLTQLPKIKNQPLIVEGAGGLMVPITPEYMMIDLIADLGIPAILVIRGVLGTLNHTLMSLEVMRYRGIKIHSVIINGHIQFDNYNSLKNISKVENIVHIPFVSDYSKSNLMSIADNLTL